MYLDKKKYLIVLIFMGLLIFSQQTVAVDIDRLSNYSKIAESSDLVLYLNPSTTEIALLDKYTDQIWFSNPPGDSGSDNYQLAISYYEGTKIKVMNNFDDSVKHGQFEIIQTKNGVRINYTIGNEWNNASYIPEIISGKKFDLYISRITDNRDQNFVKDQFYKISITKTGKKVESFDIHGIDMDEIFEDFKFKIEPDNLSDTKKRELIQKVLNNITEAKGYYSLSDIKKEDVAPLKNKSVYVQKIPILPFHLKRIADIFKKVDLNPEIINREHEKYNYEVTQPNIEVFELTIEYKLEGNNFIVNIPHQKIKYPIDVFDPDNGRTVTFPLSSISVLRFFGAAGKSDEGYIFIPDGSGALINLNNGRTDYQPYTKEVYGKDFSIQPVRSYEKLLSSNIHFPVYGLKKGGRAFFAIIEEGDVVANINADIAGIRGNFNTVYSEFEIVPSTTVKITNEKMANMHSNLQLNLYQIRNYSEDIVIRFSFLYNSQANYSGMASLYREYLKNKYNLPLINTGDDIPLFLELIGGIDAQKAVLGMPRKVVLPLTTYDQTLSILKEIKNVGIENIKLIYSGWSKGGIRHEFPEKIKLEENLGEKESFVRLVEYAKDNGVEFYPENAFLYVYDNKLLDGFNAYRDRSRSLTRVRASIYEYNIASYSPIKDNNYPIVSPESLDRIFEGFLKGFLNYNLNGLAIRHMGQDINSNFQLDEETLVDRAQAREIILSQLENLQNKGIELLLKEGNVYTLPFSKNIVNLPLFCDNHGLIDEGIPFLQMVLHGLIDYTSKPINLSEKKNDHFLKLIETGSYPYYSLSYQDSSMTKNTDFEDYYSINYHEFREELVSYYEEVNKVLKDFQNHKIINHRKLMTGVYQTDYDNLKSIIVNYNNKMVEVDGLTVSARSYIVVTRGEES